MWHPRGFRTLAAAAVMAASGSNDGLRGGESPGSGANAWHYVASPEPGWPQWRGPRRDGICDETGLLGAWPEGGPRVRWTATNVGRGYSAPVISGGRLYLAGDVEADLVITALDLEGRTVWRATNGASWKDPYPGARASAVIRNGRLFHLNAHGRAVCLDASTGREHWAVEIFERFGGRSIHWGNSECLLVDGDRVLVTPGGTRALMAALDVRTGATVWQSEPLRLGPGDPPRHERVPTPEGQTDNAGYASPILVERGGRRMVIGCSLRHAFGVDAETGRLLWTRPLRTRFEVIAATPVLVGDGVFVTAPDAGGGRYYPLQIRGGEIEPGEGWTTELDTCHGGVVQVGDVLVGSWYRSKRGWACVDAATGRVRYERTDVAKGATLYADGRYYCLSEEGEMLLLETGETAFVERGRFRFVEGRANDVWTHPVILGGRLYLRHHERLVCFEVRP